RHSSRLCHQYEFPLAKSFISQRKTELPRPAASRAMPHPLTPPPMIARSKIRSKDAPPAFAPFILEILLSVWSKTQPIPKAIENARTDPARGGARVIEFCRLGSGAP